jgi:NAD(P)-dependent dehydrogenase (short-subunit alcohol dehydrogenase family)
LPNRIIRPGKFLHAPGVAYLLHPTAFPLCLLEISQEDRIGRAKIADESGLRCGTGIWPDRDSTARGPDVTAPCASLPSAPLAPPRTPRETPTSRPRTANFGEITRSLAVAYAPQRVPVNAIAPSATMTERVRKLIARNVALTRLADSHLLGLIEPDDIASTALYLASDESRMVTGQVMLVDS